MADNEVSVRFRSKEEAQLWQSFQKLATSLQGVRKDSDETAVATTKVDASLKRFVERMKNADATPLEKATATIRRLDTALASGAITSEEFGRLSRRATADYAAALEAARPKVVEVDAATKALVARIKQLDATPLDRLREKNITLRNALQQNAISSDQYARQLKRHADEYQAELAESEAKTKRLGAVSRETSGQSEDALSEMLGTLSLSSATATAAVSAVFSKMRDEAQQSAELVKQSYRSSGLLGQLGDRASANEKRGMATQFFASGAAQSMAEANQAVFDLSNAGALGDLKLFSDLQRSGLVANAGEFAKQANQLQTTLGDQAGNFPQLLAKSFVAAAPTKATPEQLIAAASRSGQSAATLGIQTPELLAATGVMVNAKGIEEGGSRLASLLAKLTTLEGVEGSTLQERIASIDRMGMSPAELKKFIGDETSVEAIGILSNRRTDVAAQSQAIAAASPDLLARRIADNLSVREIAVGAEAQRQENLSQLSQQGRGVATLAVDAELMRLSRSVREGRAASPFQVVPGLSLLADRMGSSRLKSFVGEMDAAALSAGAPAARWVPGVDEAILRGTAAFGGDRARERLAPAIEALEAPLKRFGDALDAATKRLESTTQRTSTRFDWPAAARRDQAVEAR